MLDIRSLRAKAGNREILRGIDLHVDPGEECDTGGYPPYGCDYCSCYGCGYCGDGNVDPGEYCDYGSGSQCGDYCWCFGCGGYCGDGIVDAGEYCDNGDGCCDYYCPCNGF